MIPLAENSSKGISSLKPSLLFNVTTRPVRSSISPTPYEVLTGGFFIVTELTETELSGSVTTVTSPTGIKYKFPLYTAVIPDIPSTISQFAVALSGIKRISSDVPAV